MEEVTQRGRWRRFRWRIGSLMLAVLGIAILLVLSRPFAVPADVRAAKAILQTYGPKADPGFRLQDYTVASVAKTPSGYMQVRFVRIAGQGKAEHVVGVPARSINQARLNPWWSPPNLALHRTRPAAAPSGNIKGGSGGPVR